LPEVFSRPTAIGDSVADLMVAGYGAELLDGGNGSDVVINIGISLLTVFPTGKGD